jgi:hypothetical protein
MAYFIIFQIIKSLNKMEKELKIKTGVLKRYLQEVEFYRKELQKQSEKINALKDSAEPDQYVIKVNNKTINNRKISLNNISESWRSAAG